MTPREMVLRIKAASNRLRREHNDRMTLAWHIAALSRAKKVPKLKTLLASEKPKATRRQTVDEQIAIAKAWTAALKRQ